MAGLDSTRKLMFIGVVIGEWYSIKNCWSRIVRRLKVSEIHMYKFSSSLKRKALMLLLSECRGLSFLCIKINYPLAKAHIKSICPRKPKHTRQQILNNTIKQNIESILSTYTIDKYIVDKELNTIFEDATNEPKESIELADMIAWTNLRHSQIPKELRKKLTKQIKHHDIEKRTLYALQKTKCKNKT